MKKRVTALCSVMLVLSICVAVFGVTNTFETDTTTAIIKNYYAPKTEDTTSNVLGGVSDILGGIGSGSSGDIGDILGGIGSGSSGGLGDSLGGIGDSLGGVGDSLGGLAGGLGDALGGIFGGGGSGTVVKTTAPSTTSADIGLIIPVPAATQTPSETQAPSTSVESSAAGETVDYASTSNPYTKPTSTFSAGDEDETIKWLQWIFIYTHYGLNDNGITGVLDEATVAVVKKLQHENKLTVDGNINEDVIKAAEVLYYQSILGDDVSAIEVSSEATTGEAVSTGVDSVEKESNISTVILLIVVLIIIWVMAIGGIVLLFVFKKKKINALKNASAENTDDKATPTGENDSKESTEIKSLSDLFDEAERKDN